MIVAAVGHLITDELGKKDWNHLIQCRIQTKGPLSNTIEVLLKFKYQ